MDFFEIIVLVCNVQRLYRLWTLCRTWNRGLLWTRTLPPSSIYLSGQIYRAASCSRQYSALQTTTHSLQPKQQDNGVFPKCFLVNSLNSVTKKLLLQQKDSNPSHLLCERPTCYHSASTTHVRDRILKVQFMLQWFIWFPEFAEFSEHFPYLGKTPVFQ